MSKIDNELVDPVIEPEGEKAHRATRAGLSAVPVLGGALVEAFSAIIEPPMARRKTAWMKQVTEAINELYEKGIVTEADLMENEKFFTTLVHASNVALKNHQQEKITALRNATINSALPGSPDDATQQMYLNQIDTCTEWHIHILKLFHDPQKFITESGLTPPNWSMGGPSAVLEFALPDLNGRRSFYDLIWKDLYSSGLVSSDSLHVTMSGPGMIAKRTTEFGDGFVNFISEPAL